MSGVELLLWGIAGIIFMAINLIFAHWIGKEIRILKALTLLFN